jgi:inorganic triphosphatase YgiF
MTQQVVLKLAVAEDRHGGLLRHPALASATSRVQQQLVSIYYDTGRLALRRAGVLLRLRKQGASWQQMVKRQEPIRRRTDDAAGVAGALPQPFRFHAHR